MIVVPVLDEHEIERQAHCQSKTCWRSVPNASRPLFRDRNETPTFMGIVERFTSHGRKVLVKLNDSDGSLDGPGHEVDAVEFMLECLYYDGFCGQNSFAVQKLHLFDGKTFQPTGSHSISNFYSAPLFGLEEIPSNDRSAAATCVRGVRAGDRVNVVAIGKRPCHCASDLCPKSHHRFRESFWVNVLCCTVFGEVTGIAENTLENCDVCPDSGLLSFSTLAVAAVQKGKNWVE